MTYAKHATCAVEGWKAGIDTRQGVFSADPSGLRELINMHVSENGNLRKRFPARLVRTLPTGTKGFTHANGKDWVLAPFGTSIEGTSTSVSGVSPQTTLPSGVGVKIFHLPNQVNTSANGWEVYGFGFYGSVAWAVIGHTVDAIYGGHKIIKVHVWDEAPELPTYSDDPMAPQFWTEGGYPTNETGALTGRGVGTYQAYTPICSVHGDRLMITTLSGDLAVSAVGNFRAWNTWSGQTEGRMGRPVYVSITSATGQYGMITTDMPYAEYATNAGGKFTGAFLETMGAAGTWATHTAPYYQSITVPWSSTPRLQVRVATDSTGVARLRTPTERRFAVAWDDGLEVPYMSVGDGTTVEFVTPFHWNPKIDVNTFYAVYVNGVLQESHIPYTRDVMLFEKDGMLAVRFTSPPQIRSGSKETRLTDAAYETTTAPAIGAVITVQARGAYVTSFSIAASQSQSANNAYLRVQICTDPTAYCESLTATKVDGGTTYRSPCSVVRDGLGIYALIGPIIDIPGTGTALEWDGTIAGQWSPGRGPRLGSVKFMNGDVAYHVAPDAQVVTAGPDGTKYLRYVKIISSTDASQGVDSADIRLYAYQQTTGNSEVIGSYLVYSSTAQNYQPKAYYDADKLTDWYVNRLSQDTTMLAGNDSAGVFSMNQRASNEGAITAIAAIKDRVIVFFGESSLLWATDAALTSWRYLDRTPYGTSGPVCLFQSNLMVNTQRGLRLFMLEGLNFNALQVVNAGEALMDLGPIVHSDMVFWPWAGHVLVPASVDATRYAAGARLPWDSALRTANNGAICLSWSKESQVAAFSWNLYADCMKSVERDSFEVEGKSLRWVEVHGDGTRCVWRLDPDADDMRDGTRAGSLTTYTATATSHFNHLSAPDMMKRLHSVQIQQDGASTLRVSVNPQTTEFTGPSVTLTNFAFGRYSIPLSGTGVSIAVRLQSADTARWEVQALRYSYLPMMR